MTFHLSELFRKYRVWCPNSDARPLRTAPPVLATPPVTLSPVQAGGGAGGAGRIDRGIKLATGSIRLLIRNRQLLWFSLLSGLVMVFSLVSTLYLQFISGTALFPGTGLATGPASVMISHGSLPWIALTFIIGLVSTFLTYYLLAALIASVSLIHSGRTATVRDGLAHAGQYLRPLFSWVAIGACIGTVSSVFMTPATTTGGALGNLGILFLVMAISGCFYILTLFVVPVIVLANEDVIAAVTKSVSLFRKVWGEILVCFIIYFLIAFAVQMTSLVPMIAIGFSGSATSASAAVAVVVAYMLVMLILLFIGSTIVGITITGLYLYGKTGILPAMFEGKPVVQALV